MRLSKLNAISTAVFLPLLLAFSAPLNPAEPAMYSACEAQNNTFIPGETITYKLYYNWNLMWMAAGEVTFTVYDDGDEYHLSARGRTYESYEWFFKVRDSYDSYISKENLLPRISIRDIQEGDYKRYEKVVYDQANRSAVSTKGHSRADATSERMSLNTCMHDILSIVYYMRTLNPNNMRPGEQIPISVCLDRDIYNLKVKYLGKEASTRVRDQGKFKTHKLSPQLIAGEVFNEDAQMTVWVSDDQNKIPLVIESPVSVGSVKAVLKSYSGLKYPLSSKLN